VGVLLIKNAPYKGWDSSSYRIEMQAVPVEDWDGDGGPIPGTPYWVSLEDIVLPNEVWEAVMDAIDAKCKLEDAERRTPAKARQANQTPRSRKRHRPAKETRGAQEPAQEEEVASRRRSMASRVREALA
jgi:hypothetical protein